jgi:hypothetical protein
MSESLDKAMGDGSLTGSGINPSSTPNPHYPGVGIKYPDVNPGGKRKSRRAKKLKARRGISADANNSIGAFASGGPGGSMGVSKSEGSMMNEEITPNMGCDANSPDCGDPMCKMCAKKIWNGSAFGKRDYNTAARDRMAGSGVAMPDGSFPIATVADLHNAIRLYGHAKDPEAAKAHIKSRARALGATDQLPETWK